MFHFLVVIFASATFLEVSDCAVIIVGGTTAAISAAIASASEKVATCLIEPTDWVGGQLTASGVPAVDFEHRTLKNGTREYNIAALDKKRENVTPNFWRALHATGATGHCWVSDYCFLPKSMIERGLNPLISEVKQYLRIWTESVIKRLKTDSTGRVTSLEIVSRTAKAGVKCGGYGLLADSLEDWYSEKESAQFRKQLTRFTQPAVVLEASEWGEVLALSQVDFLQGVEQFDGDTSDKGLDKCGQSTVFGFTEVLSTTPQTEPANPYPVTHADYYSLGTYTWNSVWTYRRLVGSTSAPVVGDISLQNWGTGNDYPFGYLFKTRKDTTADAKNDQWSGGIDLDVVRQAEYLAYGWHYAFKELNHTPDTRSRLVLGKEEFMGTCTGLSKLPYIRDTRRGVGLDGFILTVADVTGDWQGKNQTTATIFSDRVAIGSYPIDTHTLKSCQYPAYIYKSYTTLPYTIPFRALTHRALPNVLLAGKTIAQSYLTNAATRLHPTEWSTGTAAGVAAAWMVQRNLTSTREALKDITALQARIKLYTPIDWTF